MITVQTLTFANVATVAKVLWPQRSCAAATKVCVVKQLLTIRDHSTLRTCIAVGENISSLSHVTACNNDERTTFGGAVPWAINCIYGFPAYLTKNVLVAVPMLLV